MELVVQQFRDHGIGNVTVFRGHEEFLPSEPFFKAAGITPRYINHGIHQRMSEFESEGYRLMHSIVANGRIPKGLCCLDDIVARGATRALLETGIHRTHDIDIVVICGRQEVMPLGLPVTFVVHDTEELAKAAVRIVMDQTDGREPSPASYSGAFQVLAANAAATTSPLAVA